MQIKEMISKFGETLLTSTSWLTPLAVFARVTRSSCILSTHDLMLQKSEKRIFYLISHKVRPQTDILYAQIIRR